MDVTLSNAYPGKTSFEEGWEDLASCATGLTGDVYGVAFWV